MEAVPPVPTAERPREATAIPADDQQETDVWWGAYAGRTMLPSFVLCGLITVVVIVVWLTWVEYHLSELTARYTAYAVIGPLWLLQLGRWLYHILTQTYRLTTRRLYIERTFFHVPARVVDLRQVSEVAVEATALERRLKVGRVRLRTEDPQQPDVPLEGVYDPQQIARQIRDLAKPK